MKKRGISIRYKILLLLTSIPLVMLSAYLVLALRIFEEDKIAYVFDSSTSMAGTMATQVKTQLNGVLAVSKPILQDYLSQQKFSTLSESIFQNEYNLEAVMVLTPDASGVYQRTAGLEKVPQQSEALIKQLGSRLSGYVAEVDALGRVAKVPFGDDRFLILEKVKEQDGLRTTLFGIVVRMSETAEMFKAAQAQKIYLVTQDGSVLFGPEKMVGNKITDLVTPSVLSGPKQGSVALGAETLTAKDGSQLLVSFSKTGFGDLIVVTTVEKEKALSAMQVLIRRSLIFFGVLIALTVIISLMASNGITQSLTQLFSATKKVSQGNFNVHVQVNSSDEVGELAENFNMMAAEVSRLLEQTAEKARMQSELQTARTVQETLFPEALAKIGPLSIAGFYEPASECGGDWWHYCQIGQKIFLWIGDATGHGAPAALITSAAKSASTIIERLNITPAKALELLNRSIYDVSKGRIMMTFFLASYDLQTGELVYGNASHEAPFLMKKSDQPLKKKDLVPLNEVNSPRLGQARDTQYEQTTVIVEPGDAVFFYTDGIPDIQSPSKEAWGEREFIKNLLASYKDYPSVEDTVRRFSKAFQGYRQGTALVDDVTFFVVKNDTVV